ncbi:MAG TPA: DUF6798 domain-containing protein [Pirellulales bacterium]|nr:DUF6798 domain-containing protein [Pirellulales bacterium]
MSDLPNEPRAASARRRQQMLAAVEIVAIVGVFWLLAGWPPPDPNEAHYLGKAKHFWDPNWIPSDAFLDSHDTHLVFYVCGGWLTRWCSLAATAWIGRFLCWTLLAIGWQRLSWALVPRPGWAVLTTALYALLVEHFQMAGEWVVGGFEAKSIAYGLIFLGLAELAKGNWRSVWPWLGAAASFHVLAGGWTVIAASVAWLLIGREQLRLRSMLPWMLAGGVLALPGLLPALEVGRGISPQVVAAADEIYVFRRLYHHTWPPAFNRWFIERHALEFLLWVALCALYRPSPGEARIRGVVAGAMLISAVGLLLAFVLRDHPAEAAGVLRFYWFRLGDALLPLGVSVAIVSWLAAAMHNRPRTARWLVATLLVAEVSALAMYLPARLRSEVPRADARGKVLDYGDWRAACGWIAANTPATARFLTPRASQTFKWYAGRSEVATWKDMPQKPEEIVEWWQRLERVYATGKSPPNDAWYGSLSDEPVARLHRVGKRYDADYLLTDVEPRLALPVLYQNNSYAVYRLTP